MQTGVGRGIMSKVLAVLCVVSSAACAETIWQEDWADVEDWSLYEGPPVEAWWKGDAGNGLFGVSNANTWAHFLASARATVDVKRLKDYVLMMEVKEVSKSMSYQVDLDAFDANGMYLRTITLYPQDTDVEMLYLPLKGAPKADWKDVVQVAPKLGVSTGKGSQQMRVGVFKIEKLNEQTAKP